MPRYFIELQYNGKNYHGWQKQPKNASVQAEIDEKLSILLKEKIETVGAGRTDTGVHAHYFVAHFDYSGIIEPGAYKLVNNINRFIANDINILRIVPVHNNAHARFDAISRTYIYKISEKKDVFNQHFVWQLYCGLDIELMNQACEILKGFNNFKCFSKYNKDLRSHECNITEAKWHKKGGQLIFTISANRFLRNMVRAIVGTMIDIGRNKTTLDEFRKIIESENRSISGESAPAHGLMLYEIKYSYIF